MHWLPQRLQASLPIELLRCRIILHPTPRYRYPGLRCMVDCDSLHEQFSCTFLLFGQSVRCWLCPPQMYCRLASARRQACSVALGRRRWGNETECHHYHGSDNGAPLTVRMRVAASAHLCHVRNLVGQEPCLGRLHRPVSKSSNYVSTLLLSATIVEAGCKYYNLPMDVLLHGACTSCSILSAHVDKIK